MKFNFVTSIIAIAISALIAYGMYSFSNNENNQLISIGSLIFIGFTLISTIGISYDSGRKTANIRVVSMIFFFIALLSNIIFSYMTFGNPIYIITNGILLLSCVLINYSISKAKQ